MASHEVTVVVQRPASPLMIALGVVAFLMAWKIILVIVAVALTVWGVLALASKLQADHAAQQARDAETASRADEQLSWYMSGDPRGIFGREHTNEPQK